MGKMKPVVTILQGAVEGVQCCDLDEHTIYKFLGIPYAKPPVGELRFKEPQAPASWIGVKDAKSDGNACYHYNELAKEFEGSEDCLYLNVFTRELPQDGDYNLKPVMVWIHGGGFTGGSNSSKMYGPEFLLSEDVVLVTINYRLGFLGFLRFKDATFNISGNMGFKDQVQALHWVKDNIQQFNGDPDNITLFGESAGAAAVHYHVLSPLSRGLFHKAILQSGAALNPWADECDHSTVQIAKMIDSKIWTEKEAYNILKNLTTEELYGLQVKFLDTIEPGAKRPIGLVIEPEKKSAFISKRPIDIISSGNYKKIPLIFGYTNREGLLFNALRKSKGDTRKLIPDYFIPHNVNFKGDREVRWKYINQLQNLYFSGPSREDNDALILGDAWFVAGIIGSVKNHFQTSPYPVFLYKLSLETQLNFAKVVFKATNQFGCSHADDLGYLFKTFATPEILPGSEEDIHLRRILRLWTNFARCGNPTPDEEKFDVNWKPARPRQLNTLHIKEELQLEVNPEVKRIDLWRQIYHEATSTNKYL
ncbi:juvenile hormone esterase-like [Euwallacea fornicatus]|uniref:juvenile hormone esterase-like n=1 Tax=Euwallacea fornicatus TaxID=995702 RepID=UPI00339021B4